MSKGGGGVTKFGQGRTKGEGGKKSNILPGVLCEWPLVLVHKSLSTRSYDVFLTYIVDLLTW